MQSNAAFPFPKVFPRAALALSLVAVPPAARGAGELERPAETVVSYTTVTYEDAAGVLQEPVTASASVIVAREPQGCAVSAPSSAADDRDGASASPIRARAARAAQTPPTRSAPTRCAAGSTSPSASGRGGAPQPSER